MQLTLVALLALATQAIAAPAPHQKRHVLHEKRAGTSSAWVKRDAIAHHHMLPIAVGLKQTNLHLGDGLLAEISDPDSPRYGQHYSAKEVIDMFAPSTEAVEAVKIWLIEAGISRDRIKHSENKQWLQFDATVGEANELFKTTYYYYDHKPTDSYTVACDEYHLPIDVTEHVDYVTPGLKLFHGSGIKRSKAKKSKRANKINTSPIVYESIPMLEMVDTMMAAQNYSNCTHAETPKCIQKIYNIPLLPLDAKVNPDNKLGIFEDLAQYLSLKDLSDFITYYGDGIPTSYQPTPEGIDGAPTFVSVDEAGGETMLDFEISLPIIYPQGQVLFTTDDAPTEANYTYEGFLNNFYDAIDGSYCTFTAYGETGNSPIDPPYPDPQPGGYKGGLQCGVYKATNVISISYGGQENFLDTPYAYQQRQCAEVMKLGMQGITVVVSSGDDGVQAPSADPADPDNCLINGKVFNPAYPATCPYYLTVGATTLPLTSTAGITPEVAVYTFASGGGFSNLFPRPGYQNGAVQDYFHRAHLTYKSYNTFAGDAVGANGGIYNRGGRGYPDVGAIGSHVVTITNGNYELVGGTSASAPLWGAVLTRVNEARLAVGKKPVGFINPTLYKHHEIFNDIVEGSNPGCGTDGFPATKGWDPVTGLGSPNYPKVLALFMSLP